MTDDVTKSDDEIEVTPQMVEAGLLPLYRINRERDIAEEAVSEIFLAMWRARANSETIQALRRTDHRQLLEALATNLHKL